MVDWHRDELMHQHTPGVGSLHQGKEKTHQHLVPGQMKIKKNGNGSDQSGF